MTIVSGPWIAAPGTQAVLALLGAGGHQAYAVGGCVRNALLGMPVTDVDIATDATPEQVLHLAAGAEIRAVPTGIDHGTVTLVYDGTGYEVTTFRDDVETDGRHAVVRFSTDVATDAARRDFTMNALYADRFGAVLDPLGGLPDVLARHVRFIGDPRDRIREDYLRILRFFRFSAWYGDPALGLDADALDGIARSLDGLEQLSRERVGAEIVKLAGAPDPAPALAAMARCGVLGALLPGAVPETVAPLVHFEQEAGLPPSPMRRLACLGLNGTEDLRFSRSDAKALALLAAAIGADAGLAELAWRHGAGLAQDVAVLRAAVIGGPLPSDWQTQIARGAAAEFPIKAADLMPEFQGPALGARLAALERAWISSGFQSTRKDLLN